MNKRIVIFGAGFYGKSAYWKLKDKFEVLFYVDNNKKMHGQKYEGIDIISPSKLKDVDRTTIEIIVCTKNYYEISYQLIDMKIYDFYIFVEGFLYHTGQEETMAPVELFDIKNYKKNNNSEKNILYVQNEACIRTHKIAKLMKEEGYKVFLLYTVAPPRNSYKQFEDVYEEIWTFTTSKGILDFVQASDFNVIHCSNEPDILVNIMRLSNKPTIADTHDMQSIRADIDINAMVLEYMANSFTEGEMYVSQRVADIAIEKYNVVKEDLFFLENTVYKQVDVKKKYEKLSDEDGDIHCVYEGGIIGEDKLNHRYFDKMWKLIAEQGIHIHFYAPSSLELCKRLESLSPFIHYEGNISGDQLITELTKYDCGLAIFNTNDNNRLHLEATTINKVYEYLNAQLPIVSYGIESLKTFLLENKVGVELSFEGDIKSQIKKASEIVIKQDFLDNHNLTMKSKSKELALFYEHIMEKGVS